MTPEETRVYGQALGAISRLQAGLDYEQRTWLQDIPVRRALEEFDAYPEGAELNLVTPDVEALDAELRLLGGGEWAASYWRLVTLHFVARSLQGTRPYVLPPPVLELLVADLERIVEDAGSGAGPEDPLGDEEFLIDLALSRGVVLPFDTTFGQPFWVAEELEGMAPGLWIQTHFRSVQTRGFGPETFHAFVPRLVAFVRANPECQGWFGVTWLLDPRVSEISPHMAWYPQLIQSVGAIVTPAGTDERTVSDATATSATRRRLFEQGDYQPRDYRIVMPRETGLAWADAMAAEASESR